MSKLDPEVVYAFNIAYTTEELKKQEKRLQEEIDSKLSETVAKLVAEGLRGPRGPQGARGESGEKGDKGAKGDRGIKGEKVVVKGGQIVENFVSGEKGEQGDQGPIGPAGPQGDRGFPGLKGERGERGEQGLRGLQGETGPRGKMGATGPEGPIGPIGPQGEAAPDYEPKFLDLSQDLTKRFSDFEKEASQRITQRLSTISNGVGGGGGAAGGGSFQLLDNRDVEYKSIKQQEVPDGSILIFDESKRKFVVKSLFDAIQGNNAENGQGGGNQNSEPLTGMSDSALSDKLINLGFQNGSHDHHDSSIFDGKSDAEVQSKMLELGFINNIPSISVPPSIFDNLNDSAVYARIKDLGFLDSAPAASGPSATNIFNNQSESQVLDKLIDLGVKTSETSFSHFDWLTSGSRDQFRTTNLFVEDSSSLPIRAVRLVDDQIEVELAFFSPEFSASSKSLYWDQPATEFTVNVDNPDDYLERYIASTKSLTNPSATFHPTLSDYTEGAPTALPDGGVDWSQTFYTNENAQIFTPSRNLSGGSVSSRISFEDDDGTPWEDDLPQIKFNWRTANMTASKSVLSGKNFLEFYTTVDYDISISNMSNPDNHTTSVIPTGGFVSNTSGDGTMTFDVGLHKDNDVDRNLYIETIFQRPAEVAGEEYSVSKDVMFENFDPSFQYPSFYIWTESVNTSPTREDIVDEFDFDSQVVEVGHQKKNLATFIQNNSSVPRAFWFGVRKSISQPSSFKTGTSSSLLIDTVVTGPYTLDLEPDAPLEDYSAEQYKVYGITLQPGSTYVRIS